MRSKVHIIGGGISGLTLAYFLNKNGFEVSVYESENRVGGLIGTVRTKHGIAETGAHAFLSTPLLEKTCDELGVKLVASSSISKRNRFFEVNGKISRWPLGIMGTLRFLIGVIFFKFFCPKKFESVSTWARRVFGVQASELLVARALQGIYAAKASSLSASLIFGRFFKNKMKTSKPRLKGSVAPLEGMGHFCEALSERLKKNGTQLFLNTSVDQKNISDWLKKEEIVVLAVPIWKAHELLSSFDLDFSKALKNVPVIPVESTTVFWDISNTPTLPSGFGVLLDQKQDSMLGVLMNDQIFEQRTWGKSVVSETWISSGGKDLPQTICQKRTQLLGCSHVRDSQILSYYEAKWTQGLPLYGQKLELALLEFDSTKLQKQGIFVHGNFMGEIGVSKILERSHKLADALLKMNCFN